MGQIKDLIITPLKIFTVSGGDVLHAMKKTDSGFAGFGEAYFTSVNPGSVKGWKRHREMTLNLTVPMGKVRFVIHDDRPEANEEGGYQEIILSKENYSRLTIPPGVWFGFQGLGDSTNLLLNIASIPHDPNEMDRKDLDAFDYEWSFEK